MVAPRFADCDDAFQQLRTMAYEGAERRYGTVAPVTRDRLEHELAIIGMKGFADYFLVVRDIVANGPTHCGRGSVANSIVSYCLGITHVEPLGAGLLFERFLNPERKDPPDIDLDFPWDERDNVLAYVFRRYPHPQAAMVANHNCFRLRGALREVAKVHGRPNGEIREVTRRIPWYEEAPLEELLATHPNFKALDLPPSWQELARLAAPLVGVPRHLSLHPGGVVIVPTALTDYVPIERAVKTLDGHPDLTVPVIQFEKDGAEDAGLIKIDLLGNRSLAVIRDAIAGLFSATNAKDISFNLIHSTGGTRRPAEALVSHGRRSKCPGSEMVRGYEYAKGEYVMLTDEDFEQLPLPSKNTIEISAFVQATGDRPVYYEKSYYLEPDERGEKPYALLLKAMGEKELTGVATITMRKKEQLCSIRTQEGTLMLETLYYPDEVELERRTTQDNDKVNRARAGDGAYPHRPAPEAVRAGGVQDHYREALARDDRSEARREAGDHVPAGSGEQGDRSR